jgi:hypothetical protein
MSGHHKWEDIKHKAAVDNARGDRPLDDFFTKHRLEHEKNMMEREATSLAHEVRLAEEEEARRLIAEVLANRDRVGPDAVLRVVPTQLPGGNTL